MKANEMAPFILQKHGRFYMPTDLQLHHPLSCSYGKQKLVLIRSHDSGLNNLLQTGHGHIFLFICTGSNGLEAKSWCMSQ